ncbi:MAG TPA: hypothetical protein PLB96_14355 [Syntrophales bacterium]|nr:hypothetical protein [Syntrophales bacterium]
MLSKLDEIKSRRADVTDWVVHWTRMETMDGRTKSSWDILKNILQCGYIRPSKAPRLVGAKDQKKWCNTIRGKAPAVCFSEQTLKARLESFLADARRYSGCGIAFEKRSLFQYGGRPVIYGDDGLLARLHEDDKYLWVNYDPLPQMSHEYPTDWTHEREWRARVLVYEDPELGKSPLEGIPLVLPPIDIKRGRKILLPKIVVLNDAVEKTIREFISSMPEYNGPNCFIKYFFDHITELEIIKLADVTDKDERYWRLETFP